MSEDPVGRKTRREASSLVFLDSASSLDPESNCSMSVQTRLLELQLNLAW